MSVNQAGYVSPPYVGRVRSYLTGMSALLVISLLLQVVGCVTPGWMFLVTDTLDVHFGLWFIRVCTASKCINKAVDDVPHLPTDQAFGELTEYRAETITGIILCVAAIIVFHVCKRNLYAATNNTLTAYFVTGGISTLISGCLATAAAGKFGNKLREISDILAEQNLENPLSFPYSLVMTGVGGVLALVAFLVFICSRPWNISTLQQTPQYGTGMQQPHVGSPHVSTVQPTMYPMASAPVVEKQGPYPPAYTYN